MKVHNLGENIFHTFTQSQISSPWGWRRRRPPFTKKKGQRQEKEFYGRGNPNNQ